MNRMIRLAFVVAGMTMAAGCQDWNRHSMPPTDLSQPPDKVQERLRDEGADVSASVEDMLRSRIAYLEQLKRLEKLYLELGDVNRANWARRQRERTELVESYPYLSNEPAEATTKVAPEERIPEADALYGKAMAKYKEVHGVPLAGFLDPNREKARQSLVMFQELLRKYPTSDKVDDAAFYCGQIYKEYLRKEDPDDELSIKYYEWSWKLDPKTPHPARFQCAVVEDFRRHDRKRALELYHEVLVCEQFKQSNCRFAASRIEQLTDEEGSHLRPREEKEPSDGELRTVGRTMPAPAASPVPTETAADERPADEDDPPELADNRPDEP